ncbi:TPA: hypothetical protein JAL46_002690, partial [Corynebacterium striatum]|nr:hypothetical protein [Corynebacterium striatum]HAT6603338.1 hypothetical protein [Corynebacterium striatum]HAT6621216.1 hypothetical protein [Corynebacterium striatum]HAT6654253.1 hypothetical protein [Corynebacterium striatum]HAT6656751.1 hypothetical protein [Corynebacterium striatum]
MLKLPANVRESPNQYLSATANALEVNCPVALLVLVAVLVLVPVLVFVAVAVAVVDVLASPCSSSCSRR